jgi:RNA polymerase sigma-70 factor (ECF subfamily)
MEIEETTEMRLVRYWRSGDRKAGDRLLRRYEGLLYRFFSRRVSRDIDELVQRTLLACAQSVGRFEGRSSFKSYILGIAHNQFLASLRARGVAEADANSLSTLPEHTPSQLAAFREEQLILVLALIKLEPDFLTPLKLFYWGGLTVEQIAEELAIPVGTVKSRLARGRVLVKENVMRMNIAPALREETLREVVEWTNSRRE